jgi:hypothetical protein
MRKEDHDRVVQVGCSIDLIAVTTRDDEEVRRRYVYSFGPEQLERYTRETRNAVLEEAALCIEASGSKSRGWQAELLRNLKRMS